MLVEITVQVLLRNMSEVCSILITAQKEYFSSWCVYTLLKSGNGGMDASMEIRRKSDIITCQSIVLCTCNAYNIICTYMVDNQLWRGYFCVCIPLVVSFCVYTNCMGWCGIWQVISWVLCIKGNFVYIHYQNGVQESGKAWMVVWTCVFILSWSLSCKFIFGRFCNINALWLLKVSQGTCSPLWHVVMSKEEVDLLWMKAQSMQASTFSWFVTILTMCMYRHRKYISHTCTLPVK